MGTEQKRMYVNSCVFAGRISGGQKMPNGYELTYLPNGTAKLQFSICIKRKYRDRNANEDRVAKTYVTLSRLGRAAEDMAKRIEEGMPVYIEAVYEKRTSRAQDGKSARVFHDFTVLSLERNDDAVDDVGEEPPRRSGGDDRGSYQQDDRRDSRPPPRQEPARPPQEPRRDAPPPRDSRLRERTPSVD